MRFAVARDLITPDVPTSVAGFSNMVGKPFTSIHDDLYVKAFLLDDGRRRAVLVSYDLIFHDRTLTDRITDHLRQRHGVAREMILVGYSHTHYGPTLAGFFLPGQYSPAYEAFLWERTRSCLDRLFLNQWEGSLRYGVVQGDWNVNRRRPVDGKIQFQPNYDGPRDASLSILAACDADHQPRVIVSGFACHPSTHKALPVISSEYPGRLCHLLESEYYGCQAMFFQGAGGDAKLRACAHGSKFVHGAHWDGVDRIAADMAAGVRRAIARGLEPLDLNLAGRCFVVPLPTERWPRSYFERIAQGGSDSFMAGNARRVLETYDTAPDRIDVCGGVLRLSDSLVIAHLGGEPCCEIKQVVEKALAPSRVFFVGYTDAVSYVPGDSMLPEGGYEVDGAIEEYRLKGKLKPGINAALTGAFQQAMASIKSPA